jgi:hypothetical protein
MILVTNTPFRKHNDMAIFFFYLSIYGVNEQLTLDAVRQRHLYVRVRLLLVDGTNDAHHPETSTIHALRFLLFR